MVPDGNVLRTLGGLGVLGGSIPVSGPGAGDWAGDRLEVVLLQEPERRLARLLLVDLLQVLERVPLQRQERVLLLGLAQAQGRGPLRQQERRLLRCEGRALLRVQT